MSFVNRLVVPVTTNSSGAATAYSDVVQFGMLESIRYVKTDFDNGSTITITAEGSGASLWTEASVNASTSRYPRAATHGVDGAASLYAAGGVAVQDKIPLSAERIKIVIASGGATKTGAFHFYVS